MRIIIGILSFLLVLTLGRSAFPDQNKNEPSLTVSIRTLQDHIQVGDPITIELTITNTGISDYLYRDFDQGGRSENYQLKVKDETGKAVKDPRVIWRGGVSSKEKGEEKILAQGASLKRIELLNRWALIKQTGKYEVTGSYLTGTIITSTDGSQHVSIDSKPITITVLPRPDKEMETYIEKLGQDLRTVKNLNEKDEIVQRLAFTADARIIPHLIYDMYQPNPSEWTQEAFNYYVSDEEALKKALLEAGAENGLRGYGLVFLQQLGCTQKELKPLILKSLESDNPESWAIGVVFALQFPDDELTALLAKVAKTPIKDKNVHMTIISALAANRTEDSVKALKELLKNHDPEIQKLTKQIIVANFNNLGYKTGGKPLKKEDFSEIIEQQDEIFSGEDVYGKNKSDMPLTLSVSALQNEIKLGDPIPIEFNITYHGKTNYSYRDRNYDRSGRMSEIS